MDDKIETTLRSLQARHHNAIFAKNLQDAVMKILDIIPVAAVVGTGNSTTVAQLGLCEALKKRGTTLIDAFERGGRVHSSAKEILETRNKIVTQSTLCDVFLTGSNAITQDGRLVNVDAMGNRVAGMFWGHPISIIIVGKNKVVKNLNEAFHSIRKIIAPNHIRIRQVELGGRGRSNDKVGKQIDLITMAGHLWFYAVFSLARFSQSECNSVSVMNCPRDESGLRTFSDRI